MRLRSTLILLTLSVAVACAQDAEADSENAALFELQATGYAGGANGGSLLAGQLYAEKPLPVANVSAYLVAHHDRDFRSVYAGLARMFGDVQLGVGIGTAHYDRLSRTAFNPWLHLADDNTEAFLSVERYLHDDAPWFYKGHASMRVAASLLVGVYGEKDFGAGPMLSWRSGGMRIWSAVPVVSRSRTGAHAVAGIHLAF